jgi:integrase
MSASQPTPPAPNGKPTKPQKPTPDFPLTPHPSGRWCKKIRGRLHYFGPWSDPDGALARYREQADALHAGRKPREQAPESAAVKDVMNAYLNAQAAKVSSGELKARTFADQKAICDLLVSRFGKGRLAEDLGPEDFASLRRHMTGRWGVNLVKVAVQKVRSVFRHAYESGLIDRPARFGPDFAPPSLKALRLHRAAQGAKLFTAEEARRMVGHANPHLRAMILLGLNCGLGNTDVATLPAAALGLDNGWLDYPRPKTGLPRRCPLWPETVAALREALARRPRPRDPRHAGLVFVTRMGGCWDTGRRDNPLSKEMCRLLRRLEINGRKGLGFYTLRHTFRTVADEARDQPAADFMMGHEVPHMSSVYRERISDGRLRAVSDHVRAWLFGTAEGTAHA